MASFGESWLITTTSDSLITTWDHAARAKPNSLHSGDDNWGSTRTAHQSASSRSRGHNRTTALVLFFQVIVARGLVFGSVFKMRINYYRRMQYQCSR